MIERLKSVIICDNLWTKNSVEKKAANLRKQAVITKCRGDFQCGAKNRDFEKAVDFRAKIKSVLIWANQWTTKRLRPQMVL